MGTIHASREAIDACTTRRTSTVLILPFLPVPRAWYEEESAQDEPASQSGRCAEPAVHSRSAASNRYLSFGEKHK